MVNQCETTPIVNQVSECKKLMLSPKELFSENEENIQPMYIAEPISTTKMHGFNKPTEQPEREMFSKEISNLRDEKDNLLIENQSLHDQLVKSQLNSACVENNDHKCKYFTGLSWTVFMSVNTYLSQFLTKTPLTDTFSLRDQMFTTLVKLRLDIPFEFIAHHRGIALSTINDIFWRWINLMHAKLDFLIHWPDRETIQQTTPGIFKAKFPRLTAIVDCFEIFIERPKNLQARAKVYSNYKKHSTVKFFIACNPLGVVTFLSNAWGGRVSDNELVHSCGFIHRKYHHPGDQILADRGFLLQDDFATECSAELLIPAFTKGKKQLPAKDVETSRTLASVRIHIERVIGLMKNRYTILKGTLNIVLVKSLNDEVEESCFTSIVKIVRVCASLTNLGDGIVYSEN
ncbi:unnamed protein product [Mytilus coruscus]|uniref:DDE Tnp4 domain-containing protein n=1 Tax=Mytilus coruscus TaxID=42192 RepID=A0A6J8DS19_MYTCO|nr:unnamed protein product [Mytilus coruscus]